MVEVAKREKRETKECPDLDTLLDRRREYIDDLP
jgi:uncharacterized cupin superfamily protein